MGGTLPAVHGDGRPEALNAPAHACLSSPVGNVLAPPLDRGAMAGNRQQRQTRQNVRSEECRREFPEAHVGPRGAFAPPSELPPSKMGPSSPFHAPAYCLSWGVRPLPPPEGRSTSPASLSRRKRTFYKWKSLVVLPTGQK